MKLAGGEEIAPQIQRLVRGGIPVLVDLGGVRDGSWQPGEPAVVGLVLPALHRGEIERGDVLLAVFPAK